MARLISHRTTETLPSGTTITTLHLTDEARHGLSTNGATILPCSCHELTRDDSPKTPRCATRRQPVALNLILLATGLIGYGLYRFIELLH